MITQLWVCLITLLGVFMTVIYDDF